MSIMPQIDSLLTRMDETLLKMDHELETGITPPERDVAQAQFMLDNEFEYISNENNLHLNRNQEMNTYGEQRAVGKTSERIDDQIETMEILELSMHKRESFSPQSKSEDSGYDSFYNYSGSGNRRGSNSASFRTNSNTYSDEDEDDYTHLETISENVPLVLQLSKVKFIQENPISVATNHLKVFHGEELNSPYENGLPALSPTSPEMQPSKAHLLLQGLDDGTRKISLNKSPQDLKSPSLPPTPSNSISPMLPPTPDKGKSSPSLPPTPTNMKSPALPPTPTNIKSPSLPPTPSGNTSSVFFPPTSSQMQISKTSVLPASASKTPKPQMIPLLSTKNIPMAPALLISPSEAKQQTLPQSPVVKVPPKSPTIQTNDVDTSASILDSLVVENVPRIGVVSLPSSHIGSPASPASPAVTRPHIYVYSSRYTSGPGPLSAVPTRASSLSYKKKPLDQASIIGDEPSTTKIPVADQVNLNRSKTPVPSSVSALKKEARNAKAMSMLGTSSDLKQKIESQGLSRSLTVSHRANTGQQALNPHEIIIPTRGASINSQKEYPKIRKHTSTTQQASDRNSKAPSSIQTSNPEIASVKRKKSLVMHISSRLSALRGFASSSPVSAPVAYSKSSAGSQSSDTVFPSIPRQSVNRHSMSVVQTKKASIQGQSIKAFKLLGLDEKAIKPQMRLTFSKLMPSKSYAKFEGEAVTVREALNADPLVAGYMKNESGRSYYYVLTYDTLYEFRTNNPKHLAISYINIEKDCYLIVSDHQDSFQFGLKCPDGISRAFLCASRSEMNGWLAGIDLSIKTDMYATLSLPSVNRPLPDAPLPTLTRLPPERVAVVPTLSPISSTEEDIAPEPIANIAAEKTEAPTQYVQRSATPPLSNRSSLESASDAVEDDEYEEVFDGDLEDILTIMDTLVDMECGAEKRGEAFKTLQSSSIISALAIIEHQIENCE